MDRNLSEEEAIVELLETLRSRIKDLIPVPKRNKFAQGELIGYRECLKMAMAWRKGNDVISEKEYLKLITPKTRKRRSPSAPKPENANEENSVIATSKKKNLGVKNPKNNGHT